MLKAFFMPTQAAASRLRATTLAAATVIWIGGVAAAQPPADDPPTVLPETVVEGRPDPFPNQPLARDTVVTADRVETPVVEVPSSVKVITREQIQATRQDTVAEVLRGQVGLDVVRQGGPGGLTSVFLRGANSQQTKVLLDGVPINDPSNATRGFDFSTLGVENIERIEVLRGPQSVLYGSDAIGGVVNIITRRGDGPARLRVTGHGGSFGTGATGISVSGGSQRAYYSLGGSYLHTDGISAASEHRGNTERDRYRNATVSGRFGWNLNDDTNLDYVVRYSDVDAEIDQFDFFTGLPMDAFPGANLTKAFYNRLQLRNVSLEGAIEQRIGVGLTNYDRRDTSPLAFIGDFEGQTRTFDYQADVLLTDNNTLTIGTGYLQEEATTGNRVRQTNKNVFFQDQLRIADRWFTTAGFRWDDYSSAGPAETYRLGTILQIWETGTRFYGTLGTGFRAPALAENLFAFGNPNLLPEQSRGWDLGVGQQLFSKSLDVSATLFRNDFRDLIIFDFNTFALENVGRARASGVEVEFDWQARPSTRVTANYTLTATRDESTGQALLRRPRDKAQLTIQQRMWSDQARLQFYLLYVGQRLDTRNVTLDDYVLANLSGSADLTDVWQVFFRIDNLFDRRYEEVNGFGTPGFSGYAGLTALY